MRFSERIATILPNQNLISTKILILFGWVVAFAVYGQLFP
jgi:hypothetical protein